MRRKKAIIKIGATMRKIILLLAAGFQLSLSKSPAGHFYIIERTKKEFQEIDRRVLYRAIKNLYRSKLISATENSDGTVNLVLSEEGNKKMLSYKIETMELPKQQKWDGLWRMVIFDIPEKNKKGRDAFSKTLKKLGFYQLQKSVFIYPYDCKNELDFLIEFFNLRPFVRIMLIKEIDNRTHLEQLFNLTSP